MNILVLLLKHLRKVKNMSKSFSYKYSGTKGHIVGVIGSLPNNPDILLKNGWIDITHPKQKKAGHIEIKEEKTGFRIRFDRAKSGASGYKGKNHYHIRNPNASSTKDMYLDINGNPVRRGSSASHIILKGDK